MAWHSQNQKNYVSKARQRWDDGERASDWVLTQNGQVGIPAAGGHVGERQELARGDKQHDKRSPSHPWPSGMGTLGQCDVSKGVMQSSQTTSAHVDNSAVSPLRYLLVNSSRGPWSGPNRPLSQGTGPAMALQRSSHVMASLGAAAHPITWPSGDMRMVALCLLALGCRGLDVKLHEQEGGSGDLSGPGR